MYKRFSILLGIFLGSHGSAAAQTTAPQIVLTRQHVAPIMTTLRTAAPSLTASFPLDQDPGKSPARFGSLFAGAFKEDHNLKSLSTMEDVKTLFVRQSSLPLVKLWSGRLQLNAFESTLNMQNVQLGPLVYARMPDFRHYQGGTHSVDLSGLSLNLQFGRDARAGRPTQLWRSLSRMVGTVLH